MSSRPRLTGNVMAGLERMGEWAWKALMDGDERDWEPGEVEELERAGQWISAMVRWRKGRAAAGKDPGAR